VETFVQYIRSLPQDFGTVPLWREIMEDPTWKAVLKAELFPYGLKEKLDDVYRRFQTDWKATSTHWVRCIQPCFGLLS
jgi:hypothetical protein